MKELTVLSLFDGIACGRVALERAGLPSPIHADDDRVVRCDCFEAIPEEGDSE